MTKNKQRSQHIIQWLSSHPLINRAGLCDIVGLDKSNLHNAIIGNRSIPEKYMVSIEKELKKYGYK